ncbi:hypothetical protein OSTOST_13186, partial [Ostertagia ostertagi]
MSSLVETGSKLVSLQKLLADPLYIGLRHERVRGEQYDRLIDNFMKAVTKRFGRDTLIQFEDFAFQNAYNIAQSDIRTSTAHLTTTSKASRSL